jgi:hypothetical protein
VKEPKFWCCWLFFCQQVVSSTTLLIPPQPFIRTCWSHHHFLPNRTLTFKSQKRPYLLRDIVKSE